MATAGKDYRAIMADLKRGIYKPIYYLMGEESFFIDSIADYIRENVLTTELERDFNLKVVYAQDTTMSNILSHAESYPMGAERQVIIVKEAQYLVKDASGANIQPLEMLYNYLSRTQKYTILVFCHKGGTLDRRKKVVSLIDSVGVLFEAKALKEDSLPEFIEEYLQENGATIESKAESMLIESVGSDLSIMNNELEKLVTSLQGGKNRFVTPELVEQLVGISKDYNIFEFQKALINKDQERAYKIADYYESNSKKYPIQLVTASIFPFFANLMLAFYAPAKTERSIAEQLGLKSTWGAKDYITGMRLYTAQQTMNIISLIRRYDAKSKGVECMSPEGLLRELLSRIFE